MAGGGERMPGQYMGGWGNLGSQPQKGMASYSLSPNRQRPLAGTMDSAVFNTFRRGRNQFLYVIPPFIIAYATMQWAIERYALMFCRLRQ
ncbi:hypothetical protein LTS18_003190 [Coniosporium uncinatum]|uniref:Uncharacterized protein n=1 Tax=Coniosporium uncinatum TaxID=93489 RepID=A0ACC3DU54_9PEZI|nr:hypothetical protein LTS18_003190 [Coniosporium uncinatum]